MTHLRDDVGGPIVVVCHLDAGPRSIGPHKPVGDDGVKPGCEDRLGDEPVGVRYIGDLEIRYERETESGEVVSDGEARRKDQRVADLDRVDAGCTGLCDPRCLLPVEEIEGEYEFGHPSSLSRVAATSMGRLIVASP